jgi:hypothetical protein
VRRVSATCMRVVGASAVQMGRDGFRYVTMVLGRREEGRSLTIMGDSSLTTAFSDVGSCRNAVTFCWVCDVLD